MVHDLREVVHSVLLLVRDELISFVRTIEEGENDKVRGAKLCLHC